MHQVQFREVNKSFRLHSSTNEKIRDLFYLKKDSPVHHALRGLSFTVDEGDVVGIIGLNGAGKSTLSNLIAGVMIPSSGSIDIKGKAGSYRYFLRS